MLTVVNWNLEWATPRSTRALEILSRIGHREPEIVCLTEALRRIRFGGTCHLTQTRLRKPGDGFSLAR